MLKSHEKFYASDGHRLILVADDEFINREILGAILEEEYKVIFACDGQETMDQIQNNKDELSLVLLDLMMPIKSGLEVLREMKANPELSRIPVIVLTADQDAEIESLNIGAIDYISKPYPQPGIILARVLKAIELSEDRDIIQSTERDTLTGLYNREYFYRYAEQYDQHHKDVPMDAVVLDINHFHMINERFGTAYGDDVLRKIGEKIRESVADSDGIVCRREADTFMAYFPHGKDYNEILKNASIGLSEDVAVNRNVRLRLGVYANVDKSMEIERRFERAQMAADSIRNNYTKTVGFYDDKMHEKQIYAEQLIDDFHAAIEEKQFKVYYQPKFDIRPKVAALSSAEALIRWQHPTMGLISPGVFIPLFEENGLIRELDHYVWRETARQIREWKNQYGYACPVSVNTSRIDMSDPGLVTTFEKILEENDLRPEDLVLEITESAYTQDSGQIVETVNHLRNLGFKIEMDDFGTGYSSLNMISEFPIDALKLDRMFIKNAFSEQQDTRMLTVVLDIADHLAVPVIAEGVETEEQVNVLKKLGCDYVQGYYFSKPVPPKDFEPFILARKDLKEEDLIPEVIENEEDGTVAETEKKREKKPVKLRAINFAFVILTFVLSLLLILTDISINRSHKAMDEASVNHDMAVKSAMELELGSDYLTESVRLFVVTGDLGFLENYFEEVNISQRRYNAVHDMEILLKNDQGEAYHCLTKALDTSNELMELEYQAIKLTQIIFQYDDSQLPEEVRSIVLDSELTAQSEEMLRKNAYELVFGKEYESYKEQIRGYVESCTDQLIEMTEQTMENTRSGMNRIMLLQVIILTLLVLAVLGEVVFVTTQIRIPLSRMVDQIQNQEQIEPKGAQELRFVMQTYNDYLEKNKTTNQQLSFEATHDALTGLLNRVGYESFMKTADQEHVALLIIDVDKFKTFNDTYGHDVGDKVLQRVAEVLTNLFRSVDAICRIGGDEFVVVMTRANSSMNQLVHNKIDYANTLLRNPKDDLPPITLSVGVAFSDRKDPKGDLFKDADTALYEVKGSVTHKCKIHGEEF